MVSSSLSVSVVNVTVRETLFLAAEKRDLTTSFARGTPKEKYDDTRDIKIHAVGHLLPR